MIHGIGTDIVSVSRIQEAWQKHGDNFLHKILTESEINYCLGKANTTQHLAGRFAAKEAILKALGTGLSDGISWQDINIISNGGPCVAELSGRAKAIAQKFNIVKIFISISHEKEYANAMCIMERD